MLQLKNKIELINKLLLYSSAILFFVVVILWANSLLFSKESKIEDAILSGKRFEVSLSSGEVFGEKQEKKSSGDQPENAANQPAQENPESIVQNDITENKQEVVKGAKQETDSEKKPTKKQIEFKNPNFKYIPEMPAIVIVVRGLGLSSSSVEAALELPKTVTLGFTPYAPMIKKWVNHASVEGFETVLNIPMETSNIVQNDPGPYALTSGASMEDNVNRVGLLLDISDKFSAVYSDNNEVFSQTLTNVKPILRKLKSEYNKPFIYGGGYGNHTLIEYSRKLDYDFYPVDVDIDADISRSSIAASLEKLEKIANENGYAIGISRPYPLSMDSIIKWQRTLKQKNIQLIPVSLLQEAKKYSIKSDEQVQKEEQKKAIPEAKAVQEEIVEDAPVEEVKEDVKQLSPESQEEVVPPSIEKPEVQTSQEPVEVKQEVKEEPAEVPPVIEQSEPQVSQDPVDAKQIEEQPDEVKQDNNIKSEE